MVHKQDRNREYPDMEKIGDDREDPRAGYQVPDRNYPGAGISEDLFPWGVPKPAPFPENKRIDLNDNKPEQAQNHYKKRKRKERSFGKANPLFQGSYLSGCYHKFTDSPGNTHISSNAASSLRSLVLLAPLITIAFRIRSCSPMTLHGRS